MANQLHRKINDKLNTHLDVRGNVEKTYFSSNVVLFRKGSKNAEWLALGSFLHLDCNLLLFVFVAKGVFSKYFSYCRD